MRTVEIYLFTGKRKKGEGKKTKTWGYIQRNELTIKIVSAVLEIFFGNILKFLSICN